MYWTFGEVVREILYWGAIALVTFVVLAALAVGCGVITSKVEAPDRSDCASIGGQYVKDTRGSDICYVDGKVARTYG